jgi:hypothetical protein
VGTNKAFHWLLSVVRDNRGITLVELLTVVLLFSLLLGGVTSIVVMGQNMVQDTLLYSAQEEKFSNIASIIVNEGLNSSRVTQTGNSYVFENNPKNLVLEYSASEQTITILHDQTKMMKIENILNFQLNPDPVKPKMYVIIIEGLNPYGEPFTLTNRWTCRQ